MWSAPFFQMIQPCSAGTIDCGEIGRTTRATVEKHVSARGNTTRKLQLGGGGRAPANGDLVGGWSQGIGVGVLENPAGDVDAAGETVAAAEHGITRTGLIEGGGSGDVARHGDGG